MWERLPNDFHPVDPPTYVTGETRILGVDGQLDVWITDHTASGQAENPSPLVTVRPSREPGFTLDCGQERVVSGLLIKALQIES